MERPDVKKLIEEYLQEAKLMQVVTSMNNQPWACSVYFAFDDSLKLYWISKPNRRHSEEIRANEKVAGSIVLPHTPGHKVRGLQFQGVAKELQDQGAIVCMKYYAERFKVPEKRVKEILNGTDGHLCYRIQPTLIVLFDELNFPNDPRQEHHL